MTRVEYLDLREKIESRIERKRASDFRLLMVLVIFMSGTVWALLLNYRLETWDLFIPAACTTNLFVISIMLFFFGVSDVKQEEKALKLLGKYDPEGHDMLWCLQSDEFSFLFKYDD